MKVFIPVSVKEKPTEADIYSVILENGSIAAASYNVIDDKWHIAFNRPSPVSTWLKPISFQEFLSDEEIEKWAKIKADNKHPITFGEERANWFANNNLVEGAKFARSFYEPKIAIMKSDGERLIRKAEEAVTFLMALADSKFIPGEDEKHHASNIAEDLKFIINKTKNRQQ